MKKILISLTLAAGLFAMNHGETNDPDLQAALNGNFEKALIGFEKRCETKKDGYACGTAGYILFNGLGGITKDKEKALELYKKGCEYNDADSCTLLGYNMYEKDKKESKKLIEKGCKLGNKDACKFLSKF